MYEVLSPDGFQIERDAEYATLEEANLALERFVSRFTTQGYYSTSNWTRIPLDDIANHCRILEQ